MHIRYAILREKALRMMTGMHISTSILNRCVLLECQKIDLLPEIRKVGKLVTLDMSINKD